VAGAVDGVAGFPTYSMIATTAAAVPIIPLTITPSLAQRM
jgi:hypothetical protein